MQGSWFKTLKEQVKQAKVEVSKDIQENNKAARSISSSPIIQLSTKTNSVPLSDFPIPVGTVFLECIIADNNIDHNTLQILIDFGEIIFRKVIPYANIIGLVIDDKVYLNPARELIVRLNKGEKVKLMFVWV